MKANRIILLGLICICCIVCITSANYTIRPTINTTFTITTIPTNVRYSNITAAAHLGNTTYTNATPEFYTMITQTFYVFFDAIGGPVALTIIFSLPFVMSFIGGKSLRITAILGLIVSPFMLIFLPANYAAAAGLCIIISGAGLIWSVIKS